MSKETEKELREKIEKSGLIEVPATRVVSRSGHPVIEAAGTMFVHKDDKARVEQRTKDLQAHAATARKLAASEKKTAALIEALEALSDHLCIYFNEQGAFPVPLTVIHQMDEALAAAKGGEGHGR